MTLAMRFVLLVGCGSIVVPMAEAQVSDTAAPPPVSVALARQVLNAAGSVETAISAMQVSLSAQRAASSLPGEFWTRLEARITQDAPQLGDSIAVLYAKRFTQEELQGLLTFYQSPLGRRLRQLQPGLVTESAAMGRRWGMRVAAEIRASLPQTPP